MSSTVDRLRELLRNSGNGRAAQTPPSVPASPAGAPVSDSSPAMLPSLIGAGAGAARSPVRELTYEPVDEAGQPMPTRDSVPALPGASLLETPLGRCVVIDRAFEADGLHGRIRIQDGSVTPGDVIGFCEAQARARDTSLAALTGAYAGGDDAGGRRPGTYGNGCRENGSAGHGSRGNGSPGNGNRGGSRSAWRDVDAFGAQQDLELIEAAGPVMFLDLETTGLSGGAGTVAFLVGCGYFENGAFRTRQFLLPGFASERALLHAVTNCLAGAGCLVTYNGRTFDLPVMETRWLFHRQPIAWTDLTHLDMLHVSRRLWRARGDDPDASCRLVFLERDLFGVTRIGDVPGYEIPARYFDYVRHGDAGLLEPVLHHNRLDLLSLALLTARAIRLLRPRVVWTGLSANGVTASGLATSGVETSRVAGRGEAAAASPGGVSPVTANPLRGSSIEDGPFANNLLPDGSLADSPIEDSSDPQEWLAVGRELLRLHQPARAESCFRAVVESPLVSDGVRAEALYTWARMLRRARRHRDAADIWRKLVGCRQARAALRTEAQEALAVHYEHRDRDLEAAHQWASGAYAAGLSHSHREAVAHRLARLRRKMGVQAKGGPKTASYHLPWTACD